MFKRSIIIGRKGPFHHVLVEVTEADTKEDLQEDGMGTLKLQYLTDKRLRELQNEVCHFEVVSPFLDFRKDCRASNHRFSICLPRKNQRSH